MSKRCGPAFSLSLLNPRYWLTWITLCLSFLVSLLPNKARHAIGTILGKLIYKNNTKRRNIVKTNLRLSFPELDDSQLDNLTLKNLQWYAIGLLDYSLFFFAGKRRLGNMLAIDGKEHIDKALNNKQNIIIFLAHSTMLEFAPAALSLHYACYGSYKSSKNPVFDWIIARSRCRHVKFAVSRQEGMRKLVKSLIPGQLLIFLPDEDLGEKNAVFAPFFGTQKATLTTPARLAKLGKATCLPAFAWYDPDTHKYRLQIAAPLNTADIEYPGSDAVTNAKRLNAELEKLIRQHPEQYMWILRLFRTRPKNEKQIY
jgi:lipid A biosynthesis lauroyl/palmitoleoyl acyltransferase